MAMSRVDFTRLAEWVGQEEADQFTLGHTQQTEGSLIRSLAGVLTGVGNFKPDRFIRHAERERDIRLGRES